MFNSAKTSLIKNMQIYDFTEYLQSLFLLGIFSSIAFECVFTVHKAKSVSFPPKVQKAHRRARILG